MVKLCGVALLCAVFAVLMGQMRGDMKLLVSVVGGTVLLSAVLGRVSEGVGYFSGLLGETALAEYQTVLMKTLGVGMVVQSTADVCRDCGEGALAAKVELLGKTEVLLLSLPLVKGILTLTKEILQL